MSNELNVRIQELEKKIKELEYHEQGLNSTIERLNRDKAWQSQEIMRLHTRFVEATNKILSAVKLLQDPFNDDLSKVKINI